MLAQASGGLPCPRPLAFPRAAARCRSPNSPPPPSNLAVTKAPIASQKQTSHT
jgi:hypothetical protein